MYFNISGVVLFWRVEMRNIEKKENGNTRAWKLFMFFTGKLNHMSGTELRCKNDKIMRCNSRVLNGNVFLLTSLLYVVPIVQYIVYV